MNAASPLPVFDAGDAPGWLQRLQAAVDEKSSAVADAKLEPMAAAYHSYLDDNGYDDLDEAGLFLHVMSRIVLSRSLSLLPRIDRRDEQLEASLSGSPGGVPGLELGPALRALGEHEGHECYAGEGRAHSFPRLQEPRPLGALQRAWNEMHKRTASNRLRVSPPSFVRLEVAVSRLIRGLRASTRLSLRSLLHGAGRNDAVIHFLAVLELVRRRQITALQDGLFEEISLVSASDDVDSSVRAG